MKWPVSGREQYSGLSRRRAATTSNGRSAPSLVSDWSCHAASSAKADSAACSWRLRMRCGSPGRGALLHRASRVAGVRVFGQARSRYHRRVARVPWCGDEVYEAAHAFADRCLVRDDSLFTPGRPVATLEHAEALQATVGVEDLSKGTFAGKLVKQLDGVQPDAIQLCAELLFVQLLGENDTGGAKKAENVETVLALIPGRAALATELRAALGAGGTASYGVGKQRRDAYMRFLIRLFVTLKQRDTDSRNEVLGDPWAFRDVVVAERTNAD